MAEKRSFISAWAELSDEEVLGNIKYLLEHYKDYNRIRYVDKNGIAIDNVFLTKAKFQKQNIFCVNQKLYSSSSNMYDVLNELFEKCEQEIEERDVLEKLEKKKSRRRWWQNQKTEVIIYGITVLIVSAIFGFAITRQKKLEEIDNKVKEYEKSLPNYKEYQQTQQKIANYRDSLEHAGR